MKKTAIALAFLISSSALSAQTLFSYGPHKVDKKEFLRAFEKNSTPNQSNRRQAIKDYLDLYINSRLKIQDAYDQKLDTLPQLQSELENLRLQIIDGYLSDPNAMLQLRREALARSLKDIHLAHIFISLQDTIAANKKLAEVKKRLAKGDDFHAIARELSDDPYARENGGDLNYITVFSLPYTFENIAYSLAPGQTSTPYRSKTGYHIFKNIEERKAIGKIRIEQILLAVHPDATPAEWAQKKNLADSIYKLIKNGTDIGNLAAIYSNDLMSAHNNGRVPDITVGQFDAAFENQILKLAPGELASPFQTPHGIHIVRKISTQPVVSDSNDAANNSLLDQKITSDDRIKTLRDFVYARVKNNPGIKYNKLPVAQVWGISDSLLDRRPAGVGKLLSIESVLFSIGKEKATIGDWIKFAQANRYHPTRGNVRPHSEIMEDFEKQMLYQYYQNNLEDYNEAFRIQMKEFKDGNLFFEIMQREVWNKAHTDAAGLKSVYEKNKSKYSWGNSVTALLFYCPDSTTAATLLQALKGNTDRWQEVVAPYRDRIMADSGRYEWAQLPGMANKIPVAGQPTPFVQNEVDQTTSFAYIFNVITQPENRSFEEARGLVMNDYQEHLEKEWISRLKKKYPVVINQKVLAGL